MSEHWVRTQVYCPSCGCDTLGQYDNNRPVADFYCRVCKEVFEFKSQGKPFGDKVVDGAYQTMIRQLHGNNNPSLLLLRYDPYILSVIDLLVIPRYFFVPNIIEQRNPLSPTARRAGWVGCNILLREIPLAGRIFSIKANVFAPRNDVVETWQKTVFLQDQTDVRAKGWLLAVIKCIERLNKRTFSINELYAFEDEVRLAYPANRHVKEKMRQKLQVLRNKSYLEFLGNGMYQLAGSKPVE